eukprot:scaffold3939_cov166-Amphora_coffeaeformis.AAC.16
MSESNGTSQKKRGVRFTQESIANGSERRAPPAARNDDDNEPPRKRHKRPRQYRPNEDEMDDLDDFVPDTDDQDIPSESQTLRAKRERRLKQAHDDDQDDDENDTSTRIDYNTSLAAEGIEIEPFHMRQESSDGTGYFDGDTYVFRKRDAGEEPDAWLDSIEGKEDEMIEASTAKANAKNYGGYDDDDSDAGNDTPGSKMDTWTEDELYAQIIPFVSDSETVMQAIARYGNLLKRGKKEETETTLAKKALNDLTEASSALMMRGQHDIYQKTRQNLSQFLSVKEQAKDKIDDTGVAIEETPVVQWEYQGSQDGQVHGPYTTQQMQGWIQQGYFVGASAVMIRSIRQEDVKVEMKDDLLSDLLDDDDEEDGDKGASKKPPATKVVLGDWQKSDQVDFLKYA